MPSKIEVDHGHGRKVVVLASDDEVAVDGPYKLSMRVPIDPKDGGGTLGNDLCLNPTKQLVMELLASSTQSFHMKIGVTDRQSLDKEFFIHPKRDDCAQIFFEFTNGCLVVKAKQRGERGDTLTLLQVSFAKEQLAAVAR